PRRVGLSAVPDSARLPRVRPVPRALAYSLAVSMHGAALVQQLAGPRDQPAELERRRDPRADRRLDARNRGDHGTAVAVLAARRRRVTFAPVPARCGPRAGAPSARSPSLISFRFMRLALWGD